MSIKHPYLSGSLSTRLNAIQRDQKTESMIFRALPRGFIKDHINEFIDYIANREELYSEANQEILNQMKSLSEAELQEEFQDNSNED